MELNGNRGRKKESEKTGETQHRRFFSNAGEYMRISFASVPLLCVWVWCRNCASHIFHIAISDKDIVKESKRKKGQHRASERGRRTAADTPNICMEITASSKRIHTRARGFCLRRSGTIFGASTEQMKQIQLRIRLMFSLSLPFGWSPFCSYSTKVNGRNKLVPSFAETIVFASYVCLCSNRKEYILQSLVQTQSRATEMGEKMKRQLRIVSQTKSQRSWAGAMPTATAESLFHIYAHTEEETRL